MSWTNTSKNSSTLTNTSKALTRARLLIEGTYRLLIGDGYFLSIEPSIGSAFGTSTKASSTFANQSKN